MTEYLISPSESGTRNIVSLNFWEDYEEMNSPFYNKLRQDLGTVKHDYRIPSCFIFLFKEKRLK